MEYNFSELAARDRYKLLASSVVPRPIALVTSLDEQGRINAAPFSFFNVMGADPPLVVLGIAEKRPGEEKDTARNIHRTGEFVINLPHEHIAHAMNICGIDFPQGENELHAAGFSSLASTQVTVPRIAEALVSFECREHTTLCIGRNRVIIGEVLHFHIRDELIDADTLHIHTEELHAIGRMHGTGFYARTDSLFELPRVNYASWQQEHENVAE